MTIVFFVDNGQWLDLFRRSFNVKNASGEITYLDLNDALNEYSSFGFL